MLRTSFTCLILLFACSVVCSHANAQRVDLNRAYGQGVHAYNSGDYDSALTYLNRAIDNGSTDPRAFYFRGLTHAMLNNSKASESDFNKGADLESRGGYSSLVNRSLQRVQGEMRLSLEHIRTGMRKSKTETVNIDRMRIQVSGKTPFASEIGTEDSDKIYSPNLPDSSKSNDPTSPFPNVSGKLKAPETSMPSKTDTPKYTPKPAKEETVNDVFGGNDKPTAPAKNQDPILGPAPNKKSDDKAEPAPSKDPFGSTSPKPAPSAKDPFNTKPQGKTPPADDPFAPKSNKAPANDKAKAENPPKKKEANEKTADDPFATPKKDNSTAKGTRDKPADDPFATPKKKDKKSDDPFGGK